MQGENGPIQNETKWKSAVVINGRSVQFLMLAGESFS